jgi:outer membrane immunogenic protein
MRIAGYIIAISLATVSSGLAADMRQPTKAPPLAPVWSWTGFYLGGHLGGGWMTDDRVIVAGAGTGTASSGTDGGFLGGLQAGYNAQFGAWVLGIEGDIAWTAIDISTTNPSTVAPGATTTATSDVDWIATLTGRAGYSWSNWLIYAKGGAAWMDVNYSRTFSPAVVVVNSISDTRVGWTIGAGIENAFAGNWSWKLEYNYLDFGSKTYNFTTTTGAVTAVRIEQDAHIVKAGVNYRFR